jgi:hypothetical protein
MTTFHDSDAIMVFDPPGVSPDRRAFKLFGKSCLVREPFLTAGRYPGEQRKVSTDESRRSAPRVFLLPLRTCDDFAFWRARSPSRYRFFGPDGSLINMARNMAFTP